jgi:hypothetical protein
MSATDHDWMPAALAIPKRVTRAGRGVTGGISPDTGVLRL